MRLAPLACLVVAALAGCGGGDDGHGVATTPRASPYHSDFAASPAPSPGSLERAYPTTQIYPPGPPGAPRVLVETGCLACHQIGTTGNGGPGNNLTAIGSRLSAREIRRALVDGSPPMPSFRALPRAKLDALVTYLAGLRDRDCPGASDCG